MRPDAPDRPDDPASPDRLLRRGLRLAHLRLVAALAETGRISAAAQALAISQPAASRLAAELEEILGAKLYERHARGVALTPEGERFARRARGVFRQLGDAEREIAEIRSGLAGRVRIGAVTGAAVERVLPAVRDARRDHPKIEVAVTVDTSDALVAALDAGALDFVLGRVPASRDPADYEAQSLGEEPISLLARAGHPLAGRADLDLRECVAFDWVMQPPGALLRRTVEAYLAAREVPVPARILSTASFLLTLAAVARSDAIAPVARAVADVFVGLAGEGGGLVALDAAPDLAVPPYAIVTLAGHELSPAARTLRDLIVAGA